jgi:hypothetical protein
MFHLPLDANADQTFNFSPNDGEHPLFNLIQTKRPGVVSPSPENSPPSSSPSSMSSSTISSIRAWRGGASQSLPTILPIHMNASDAPPSRGPTLPSLDENEPDDLRWSTGVPCHMMDVFRANPFATMNPSHTTSTTPPSLENSTDANSFDYSDHVKPTAKRPHSPEQKKKCRTKRARIQSPPVVPFPATGPQEMFAYEFRLDIPYGNADFFYAEDYQGSEDPPPSFSCSGTVDNRDLVLAPRPIVAYRSEDTCLRLPMNTEIHPPRLSYPYTYATSIPQKVGLEQCMPTSYHPTFPLVPVSIQIPSRHIATSNPVASTSRLGADGLWSRLEEHGRNPSAAVTPIQVVSERAQAPRPSTIVAAPSMQKPLYSCPLCPRDFQLPNGLALHLKWHGRVGGPNKNPVPCQSQPISYQTPLRVPRMESGPPDVCGLGPPQLPTQYNSEGNSDFYAALQEANPVGAESVSRSPESTEKSD